MQKTLNVNKRNYGIDALRILSMIMIVTLHLLGHGGILKSLDLFSAGHYSAWVLEIIAYCAVNCYALISGYVGVSSKFKYSGILNLCINVVFYTLIITSLFGIFSPGSVNGQTFKTAVFPYAFNVYWYFTAYFCMYFFIPCFNHLINTLKKNESTALVVSCVFLFSVLPTVTQYDLAYTNKGYSVLWLSVLYIIGAYIKKYDIGAKNKKSTLFILYTVCILINCLSKFYIEYGSVNLWANPQNSNRLVSYCSPTVLSTAVILLILFSKFRYGRVSEKLISFFAPLTFGVYLIHDEPLIRSSFITNKLVFLAELHPSLMILSVIGISVAIWLVCSLIDKVRLEIFKLLRIKQFCDKIIDFITVKISKRN